jgi:monoamine oxidase
MLYGGVHQISEMMTAKLGDRVHLNVPVNKITWDNHWAQVRTKNLSWDAVMPASIAPLAATA